jgi:hypothetical protein
MRAPLGAAAAGLALLCAKIALADAPGDLEARLQVDDGQCFHAATLARSIEQWTKAPADPRIEVRVRRSDRGISFTLVRGDTVLGERTLEVPQAGCDGMTDAVAVAIAIALDANRQEAAEPAPQNVPPAESMFQAHAHPEADEESEANVESVPAPHVVTRPHVTASAMAVYANGLLNHSAPGFALGVNKPWTRWLETQLLLLRVGETYSYTSYIVDSQVSGPLIRGDLLAAILDGCAGLWVGPARLRACLGGAFGAVLTHADPAKTVFSFTNPPAFGWGGPTARLDGRISLDESLALAVSVDGFVPVLRPPRAYAMEETSVAEAPAVGLGFSAGLAFDFQ